ncbi:MAG: hypothetical protein AAGA71_02865 [Pseudomonadota bacterium]
MPRFEEIGNHIVNPEHVAGVTEDDNMDVFVILVSGDRFQIPNWQAWHRFVDNVRVDWE